MAQELRALTVNMKSFDQDIPDPIVAGGADADGRTFRLIFSQEAEAQLAEDSKVYLSWYHQQLKIKGYNVFDQKSKTDPAAWEIKWPQKMLREGDVLCCVELVDDISIVQSQNFIVHVLADPNDGSKYVVSDDFSVFQQAVIDMNSAAKKAEEQLEEQKAEFEEMEKTFEDIKTESEEVFKKAQEIVDQIDDKLSNKLDVNRVGFDFDDDIQTIKDYVDKQVTIPHLPITEFVGSDD